MNKCAATTKGGAPCKVVPICGSQWCYVHHPQFADVRRRDGYKGGKRGGRGRPSRPSAELRRLHKRFEELADKVLNGEIERGVGAVAGQLLNGARPCMRDALTAHEQEEELIETHGSRRSGPRGSGARELPWPLRAG